MLYLTAIPKRVLHGLQHPQCGTVCQRTLFTQTVCFPLKNTFKTRLCHCYLSLIIACPATLNLQNCADIKIVIVCYLYPNKWKISCCLLNYWLSKQHKFFTDYLIITLSYIIFFTNLSKYKKHNLTITVKHMAKSQFIYAHCTELLVPETTAGDTHLFTTKTHSK